MQSHNNTKKWKKS